MFAHYGIRIASKVIPITGETSESFNKRIKKLPRNFFSDKPTGYDSDKLQHFFASAWIAYSLNSRLMADIVGISFEIGEQTFIKDNAFDDRDIRTNRLGQNFAKALETNTKAMPSTFFMGWNDQYLKR